MLKRFGWPIAVLIAFTSSVGAAEISWTGSGDGASWNDPQNWSGGAVPGAGDSAVVNTGGFVLPTSGTLTAGQVVVSVPYTAPAGADQALNITGKWTFNGAFTLSPGRQFSVTGTGATVVVNGATNISGASLSVGGGAKLSFPMVTDYEQPVNVGVSWTAGQGYQDNTGSELNFPALKTITGQVTTAGGTNGTFSIVAQIGATLNLPALKTITVPVGTTAGYSSSGVYLSAHDSGVLNAPLLATFSDNTTDPQSSLTADGSGRLVLDQLSAPVGVQINLNAISHPEQLTSLVGTRSFIINAGTVVMPETEISGLTTISVGGTGTKLSFPSVTSYIQRENAAVSWAAGQGYRDNTGCELNFPALKTITGQVTTAGGTNGTFSIVAQIGATLNLPALTTITVPTGTTAGYSSSGVYLSAHDSGVLNAPLLTAFSDNSTSPGSSLTADGLGRLELAQLSAPVGVQINLNAISHPEQLTSLVGTRSFNINAGTVVMPEADISGLTSISVGGKDSKLSFPNVTSYEQPANTAVWWTAGQGYMDNTGCELNFPALKTITGSVTTAGGTNGTFSIVAQVGATLNLPALTTITVPAGTTAGYSNSGVYLSARESGVLNAPLLKVFSDNTTSPSSSLAADGSGRLALAQLSAPVGVQINLNDISHPEQLTSLAGTRSLVINAGTVVMPEADISGLTSISVGGRNSKLSFPNVTSYDQPANVAVSWTAGQGYMDNTGCELNFPALKAITGSVTTAGGTNGTFSIVAQVGATLNLPALTTITVPAGTTAGYSNSGVYLSARESGVLNAPLLKVFSDNTTSPGSSLTADGLGRLVLDQLSAPVGLQINLNAISHPEQLTSLVGTRSFNINAGTVVMPEADISGLTSISVGGKDSRLSFPNVTSYEQPANTAVSWTAGQGYVDNTGCELNFPALKTITGSVTTAGGTNGTFNIVAQVGATLSLPALTTITVPAGTTAGYSSSGVYLSAHQSGILNGPSLTSFTDNTTEPSSALTADGLGRLILPLLTNTIGLTINTGVPLTIAQGETYVASGAFQGNVIANGSLVINGSGQIFRLAGSLTLDGAGLLQLGVSSTLSLAGDLLGATTSTGIDPGGTLLLTGPGTALAPQQLEAMSKDLGNVPSAFSKNFVFGTLKLDDNTYVKVVDLSDNAPGTGPEAVYVNSLIIPAGCTLDLNGLHLYARAVQVAGSVINGSVQQIPDAGALAIGTLTPGAISSPGELDEWTFFGRAGHHFSVLVNPGSEGASAPISPALDWANVQLLDAAGRVLTSNVDATAGDLLSLADITLPADGIYRIRVNAAASQTSATGNYLVGAWDVTPSVRSLNLGQKSAGSIATPFALDQWTFSAAAGQQIQFTTSAGAGVFFKLTGPDGYEGFVDLSGNSPLINLPSSGNYILSVYGLDGATGAYNFTMRQTSVTPLVLGAAYLGTWGGSGQAQLFSIPVGTTNPLSIVLADAAMANHTEIYARFGAPPTREIYDYAANGAGSNQRILVPSANAGTWYVLVYGESIPSGAGSFTLQAVSQSIVLAGKSTSQASANTETVLTLSGAGFNSGTRVTLVGADGTVYPAGGSTTDLLTQITARFPAGSIPAGSYTVVVTQADGSTAQLPDKLNIAAAGQGVLKTHLILPNPIGRHISCTIYVDYANEGTAAMPAPLLILGAKTAKGESGAFLTLDSALQTAGYWTSATPAGFSSSVQILASGATPGLLQPGESRRVAVYYAGWLSSQWDYSGAPLTFNVKTVKADDATVTDWAAGETSMRPAGISAEAWHIIYGGLQARMGTTSGGYVQLLDSSAAYLGRLGRNVTDVQKLWGFAVVQGENIWPMRTLGATADASLPMPGSLSLSFDRTFNASIPGRFQSGPFGLGWSTEWQRKLTIDDDGTVTLVGGDGSQAIYQPDSRYAGKYFSRPGDYSKLTAVAGGYQLVSREGIITAFDAGGVLSSVQDPNGNKITVAHVNGRVSSLTASSGQSITVAYGAAGLIASLTDSASRVTRFVYDPANQHLMSVTSPDGQVTAYTYTTTANSLSKNALTSITKPDGTHRYFTFDSAGRLASTSADGGAQMQTITYAEGQVSTTDAMSHKTDVFFDGNGQVAKTVDALGNPTYFTHDDQYNLTAVTNAAGSTMTMSYNAIGKATTLIDFLGNPTNLTYGGPQNQLTALRDAKTNATLYAYSGTGNLLKTTFANGRSENTTYDPQGNALSFVNAAGEAISYVRNAAGQLVSATFPDGSSYTYAYDTTGKMTSATDANGAVTFTYDPTTSYLTKVAYPNGMSLTFTYDSGGRRISMTDQTGFATTYGYDSVGRLAQLKDGSGNVVVTYLYDSNGRLSRKTNGNGTYTTYEYDANGRVTHLINYAPGGAINSRFDDTYNAVGLKIGETTVDGAWGYSYDANGQLTHAVFASNDPGSLPNQDLVYNYDALGNRTTTVINGKTTTYVSNNMNQYVSVDGVPYSYDAKGNLLSDGKNSYTFNVLNKLVGAGSSDGTSIYNYNSLGQRVSTISSGQIVSDLIDPTGIGDVVGIFPEGATEMTHFVYGAQLACKTSNGKIEFFDSDVLGSIVGQTDSSGSYVERFGCLPFGEKAIPLTGASSKFQYLGGMGIVANSDGSLLMRARNYLPDLGRFCNEDPSGIVGGLNVYAYSGNNPISFLDPSGLEWVGQASVHVPVFAGATWGGDVYSTKGGWLNGKSSEVVVGSFGDIGATATWNPTGTAPDFKFGLDLGPLGFKNTGFSGGFANVGDYWLPLPVSIDFGVGLGFGAPVTFSFPLPLSPPYPNAPETPGDPLTPAQPEDPNALYGPVGYGAANFVAGGGVYPYQITFENDVSATAPAQRVTISDKLSADLDWSTFQITGIGFGDNKLSVSAGGQHYQTTVSMTYNGQTFDVQIEAGIHGDTGEVYATFQSLDPGSELPPANVLTGFLPPEDGTGRGQGYLNFMVSPKGNLATGKEIRNVASIVFDQGLVYTTDQLDPHDPSEGTDPTKQAVVTLDAGSPMATPIVTQVGSNLSVTWAGIDDANGSGIGSYTVYVSTDGGAYVPWLTHTSANAGVYPGAVGHTYSFYVLATDNVGNAQVFSMQTAIASATITPPAPIKITVAGKHQITTTKARYSLKGVVAGDVTKVSYRVGKKGPFKAAKGTKHWKMTIPLQKGKNVVTIVATGADGDSVSTKLTIIKK